MYSNLEQLLFNKGISKKAYAEFLGVDERTINNKLCGITEFTYSQIRKTSELLFPEYKVKWVFKEDSDNKQCETYQEKILA